MRVAIYGGETKDPYMVVDMHRAYTMKLCSSSLSYLGVVCRMWEARAFGARWSLCYGEILGVSELYFSRLVARALEKRIFTASFWCLRLS